MEGDEPDFGKITKDMLESHRRAARAPAPVELFEELKKRYPTLSFLQLQDKLFDDMVEQTKPKDMVKLRKGSPTPNTCDPKSAADAVTKIYFNESQQISSETTKLWDHAEIMQALMNSNCDKTLSKCECTFKIKKHE